MSIKTPYIIASILILSLAGSFAYILNRPEAITIEAPTTTAGAPKPLYKLTNAPELYDLVNKERTQAGLPALIANKLLENAACAKADHMIANDYWAHVAPDGTEPWYFFKEVGYAYTNAGENLGFGGSRSSADLVDGWMNSAKHKDNIVGNFSEFGICVKDAANYQGNQNTKVIVNLFATP